MKQPFVRVIGTERIVCENLCCKLGQVYVSPCHRSAYAKLTLLTVRDLLAVFIYNICLIAVQRLSDRSIVICPIKLKAKRNTKQLAQSVSIFYCSIWTVYTAYTLSAAVYNPQSAFSYRQSFKQLRTDNR